VKPRNRVHTLTRWPSDPNRRLELAKTDIAFVASMVRIMGTNVVLDKILDRAISVKVEALRTDQ